MFKPNRQHQKNAKLIRKARERLKTLKARNVSANQRASIAESKERRYQALGEALAKQGALSETCEFMGRQLMRELIDGCLEKLGSI